MRFWSFIWEGWLGDEVETSETVKRWKRETVKPCKVEGVKFKVGEDGIR
jgi:hypothetical protein